MDKIKSVLRALPKLIFTSVFPRIAEGAEMAMKHVEDRILRIEKRILRKLSALIVIAFGGAFLMFAIFFFLKESLGWSSAAASASLGVALLVAGLLLRISASEG